MQNSKKLGVAHPTSRSLKILTPSLLEQCSSQNPQFGDVRIHTSMFFLVFTVSNLQNWCSFLARPETQLFWELIMGRDHGFMVFLHPPSAAGKSCGYFIYIYIYVVYIWCIYIKGSYRLLPYYTANPSRVCQRVEVAVDASDRGGLSTTKNWP